MTDEIKELRQELDNCTKELIELREHLSKISREYEAKISDLKTKQYYLQGEIHKAKMKECKSFFDFETDMIDLINGKIKVVFDCQEDFDLFYKSIDVLNAHRFIPSFQTNKNGEFISAHIRSKNCDESKIERIVKYKSFNKVYYGE